MGAVLHYSLAYERRHSGLQWLVGYIVHSWSQPCLSCFSDNKLYGSMPTRRWKRANSEPSNINNSIETPHTRMNTSHGDLFQNAVAHRTRGFNEPALVDSVFPENVFPAAFTPQPSPPPSYTSVPTSAPPQSDSDNSDRQYISKKSFRRRRGLGVFDFGELF